MRIQRSKLNSLVNFLLGVSWAFVFISAGYTFLHSYLFGILDALFLSFFAALPALFVVALLEYVIAGQEKLDEMRKQTELLEQILSRLPQTPSTDDSLRDH